MRQYRNRLGYQGQTGERRTFRSVDPRAAARQLQEERRIAELIRAGVIPLRPRWPGW